MTYDKMRRSFGPGGSPTKPLQRRQRITRISQNPREEQIVVAAPETNVNDLCKMPSPIERIMKKFGRVKT